MKRLPLLLVLPLLLAACDTVVLSPAGDIAAQQADVLRISTYLMLIIIIPVMALSAYFAWKYRESNREADYDPDFHHSTSLELVIWAAPLLIIICLGALTWVGTHLLDPYRRLDRISAATPIEAEYAPLEVQVVALDWKWLFIYPEYGIATVNELAAPVDRPIEFLITSDNVMNAFYVPALAGMIYAMPGMQTRLNAVINAEGNYEGLSANYSGHGFSGMRFRFHGLDDAGFEEWVATVAESEIVLGRDEYLELTLPSENVPPAYFGETDPDLYHAILNMCVEDGRMCRDEMAELDRQGGIGLAGLYNTRRAGEHVRRRETALGPMAFHVTSVCTIEEVERVYGAVRQAPDRAPVRGRGLESPGLTPTAVARLMGDNGSRLLARLMPPPAEDRAEAAPGNGAAERAPL